LPWPGNAVRTQAKTASLNRPHYEGRSINSRTVLLSKRRVTVENQNYYKVVRPLLYITYRGFVYDVML